MCSAESGARKMSTMVMGPRSSAGGIGSGLVKLGVPSRKRLNAVLTEGFSPSSMAQHIPVRWATADFADFMYWSGCCRE
jgi:hypothetical protein